MNLFCRLSPLRENCLTAPAIQTCNHPSSYRTQRRPLRYLHSARSSSKGLMKLLTYFHWSRTRIDPVSHSSSSLFSIDSTKHFFGGIRRPLVAAGPAIEIGGARKKGASSKSKAATRRVASGRILSLREGRARVESSSG